MVEKSGLRIASFNIQKFSAISVMAKANGETKKDLDTIGRIIRENQFDIIAIQEIYHKEALKELLEKIAMQLLLVQTPRIYARLVLTSQKQNLICYKVKSGSVLLYGPKRLMAFFEGVLTFLRYLMFQPLHETSSC